MMLRALYELAQREGLLDDPDYEEKQVHFYANLDSDGRLLGLVSTLDEDNKPAKIRVPRIPNRSQPGVPGFLFDKAEYVFGIGGWDKKANRTTKGPETLDLNTRSFMTLAEEVFAETADPAVGAVLGFCRRLAENRATALAARAQEEWTGGENIAFRVGPSLEPVHSLPAVRRAWARRRAGPAAPAGRASDDTAQYRCLVTGRLTTPHRLHDIIKRVQGALPKGAPLISFDKPAFVSHSLERGENAPISQAAAEGYVIALNHLLAEQRTPKRTHQGGLRVGVDSILFWTQDKVDEWGDILSLLEGPNKEEARETLESPWRGLDPGARDETPFYAVTLSGNAGRVVVRDWFQSCLGDAKASLRRYFDALALGQQSRKALPVWRLLSSIQPPSKDDVHPALAARVARVALYGGSLPIELMRHALMRLRVPPRDGKADPQLWPRCALIKAVLITHSNKELTVSLDPTKQDVPYLLGRLFAVLERLQGAALGDINATIRDRYFGAASSTPAVVFPRLLRLSVHHASKAEKLGGWLEGIKSQVINQLPAAGLPNVLGLEAQGLFAIGYYHQRESFFQKKDAAPTTTANH